MKKHVLGLSCFCVGFGMILVVIVPVLGWILTAAAALIVVGYILTCC